MGSAPIASLGDVLAAPKIRVTEGAKATLQTKTTQTFPFMEPVDRAAGAETFRLVTVPPRELGVEMTVTVLRAGEAFRLAPLEVTSTTMDGREPVPGADLEVGQPIINSRAVKIETRVKPDQVRLIPLPSDGRLTAVALRVSEFSERPSER